MSLDLIDAFNTTWFYWYIWLPLNFIDTINSTWFAVWRSLNTTRYDWYIYYDLILLAYLWWFDLFDMLIAAWLPYGIHLTPFDFIDIINSIWFNRCTSLDLADTLNATWSYWYKSFDWYSHRDLIWLIHLLWLVLTGILIVTWFFDCYTYCHLIDIFNVTWFDWYI